MDINIKLTWVDAWLLLSILYTMNKNCTFELKSVIRMGDIIEHSIFDYEEINVGTERLVMTDYLLINDNKILVSEKAIKLFELIKTREGMASPIIRFQQLQKELDVIPYGKVAYGKDYRGYSICSKEYISKSEYQNAIKGKVKLNNIISKVFIKGDR